METIFVFANLDGSSDTRFAFESTSNNTIVQVTVQQFPINKASRCSSCPLDTGYILRHWTELLRFKERKYSHRILPAKRTPFFAVVSSMPVFMFKYQGLAQDPASSSPWSKLLAQKHPAIENSQTLGSAEVMDAWLKSPPHDFPKPLRSRVVPSPFPCNLFVALPVVLVLLCDPPFDGVIGHRLCQ